MTIDDLLRTRYYKNNQSKLAKHLKVNRGTLRKYIHDLDGKHHFVKARVDGIHLFTNVSNKI